MKAVPQRPGVIWCGNSGGSHNGNGWGFPRAVERAIRNECVGSVLHLFGGRAAFGVRLDVDPITTPDVLGDAWMPPFAARSFGTVVLDPPYWRMNTQEADGLLRAAAMVAAERVIWLHTVWMARRSYLEPLQSWLIRVGDFHQCRCLQVFRPLHGARLEWPRYFTRGPAVRYNKWLAGQTTIPFPDLAPGPRGTAAGTEGGRP